MKVLIVHDRNDVALAIQEVVSGAFATFDQCDLAEDYHSARHALQTDLYDLLILDLTLPLRRNIGSATFENVHALLDELFNDGTLEPPGDIIGITRDTDALDLVENKLGPHVMVSIREDAEGKWKGFLLDKITYAQRTAQTRSLSAARHHEVDALIVTAMDVEMEPYQSVFEMQPSKHFNGASEFAFTDRSGKIRRGIAYSIGAAGQASAASLSQALISFYRPRLALMSGYCGGVKSKVNLGDLVFFEAAYAWDNGKWEETSGEGTPTKFKSRPDPIDLKDSAVHRAARKFKSSSMAKDESLIAKLTNASKGKMNGFDIYLKPAASGSAVVASEEIVSLIGGLSDSIWAVDMECYGFYHAAKYTRVVKPEFLCVKAVSDFSNGEKGDDLHTACSLLSSEVVVRLLTQYWDFDTRECLL